MKIRPMTQYHVTLTDAEYEGLADLVRLGAATLADPADPRRDLAETFAALAPLPEPEEPDTATGDDREPARPARRVGLVRRLMGA